MIHAQCEYALGETHGGLGVYGSGCECMGVYGSVWECLGVYGSVWKCMGM